MSLQCSPNQGVTTTIWADKTMMKTNTDPKWRYSPTSKCDERPGHIHKDARDPRSGIPRGFGLNLPGVYVVWLLVIVLL